MSITVHLAPTVRDHVVKMPDRCISKTVIVIGRGLRKSAADDHSIAISHWTMANDAVDVVSVLTTVYEFFRDRDRKFVNIVRETRYKRVPGRADRRCDRSIKIRIIDLTRIERFIVVKLAARNGSLNAITRCPLVAKELTLFLSFVTRLILHIGSYPAS